MAPTPRAGVARAVPIHTLLLKDIKVLLGQAGEVKDAAVFVEHNEIKWVGPTAELPAEFQGADKVLSLKDHVVLPGLINTHHHMWQCLTRCVAQDIKLFGWQTCCFEAWQHMDSHDCYISTKLAMAELILSGCTTSSDDLYIYPNDVLLDDTIRAARDIGMRFHPVRASVCRGKSQGGLIPNGLEETPEHAMVDMKRCIDEFHDMSKFSMLRVGLGPTTPYCVTEEHMIEAAQLARQHEGVRLHTHLAENNEDIEYSLTTYGCTPGEYLKRLGWDESDVWLAHCCQINPDEIKQFAEKKIGIAHCPNSNCRLADGILPVRECLDAGVNVGVGVDGSASNDAGNMLSEVRQALLLQRCHGNVDGLNVRDALGLALEGGAGNLGRNDIGCIAPGMAADIVAWRTDTINFAGCQHDLIAGLVLSPPTYVDLSIINGEIIVEGGQLLTTDLKELVTEHNKSAQRLHKYLPTDEKAFLEHWHATAPGGALFEAK